MQWLRRRFVTGFFVMVPLIISLLALTWVFGIVDGITKPLFVEIFGRIFGEGTEPPPGLGILTTAAVIARPLPPPAVRAPPPRGGCEGGRQQAG